MSEITPLLAEDVHNIDEEDVVSYVNKRRSSIAESLEATGPFVSARAGNLHGNTALSSYKSQSSLRKPQLQTDLVSILSHHDELLEEPHTSMKIEIYELTKSSIPLVVTFLLQYSLTVASVFSVGRLGSTQLAAVSLSSMTANISGYAIIQGVSTCLDTLCAQAYGRKDYELVGVHMVRCTYLLLLCWVPIFILWYFLSLPILVKIVGEGEMELCQMASNYLKILSFGLPGYIMFENAKHFLQCQGIFHASTYVLFICAPLNAFLNYLLVWNRSFGLGFTGAPLSVVITNWVMFIMIYAYILLVKGWECWPKESLFHKKMFLHWKRMIDLSIPGVLMVEAEWLAFEIITFTASKFGTEVLAAQSIISTSCVLLYQIPFAMSIAASTRVAWYIGAASKVAAITATKATLYSSLFIGIVNGVFLFAFKDFLASLFTKDELVLELASKVLIIGAAYQVNDCISCATNGILRGQGRQKIGGYLNLFSYYCIALPLAFLFAFHFKLELYGLWLGMIIALVFVSALQFYFVQISEWEDIINKSISEGIEDGGVSIDAHSLLPSLSHTSLIV